MRPVNGVRIRVEQRQPSQQWCLTTAAPAERSFGGIPSWKWYKIETQLLWNTNRRKSYMFVAWFFFFCFFSLVALSMVASLTGLLPFWFTSPLFERSTTTFISPVSLLITSSTFCESFHLVENTVSPTMQLVMSGSYVWAVKPPPQKRGVYAIAMSICLSVCLFVHLLLHMRLISLVAGHIVAMWHTPPLSRVFSLPWTPPVKFVLSVGATCGVHKRAMLASTVFELMYWSRLLAVTYAASS